MGVGVGMGSLGRLGGMLVLRSGLWLMIYDDGLRVAGFTMITTEDVEIRR